ATFDMVMEDRLNTGAKEIHDLPSALPAIPSLAFDKQWWERSVHSPFPLTGTRRTPDEPYPRTYGPHMLSMTYALGNGTMPGSATGMDMSNRRSSSLGAESSSTGTIDLPPESPYSTTNSVGFGSQSSPAAIKRESVPPVPPSPNWINGQTYSTSPNSLRLERVNSNTNNGGGATAGANSAKDPSPPPTASTTKSTESEDRLLPQTRATASRKRADDDLISHSFRTEGEWRRRAVLDNILNAEFLLDNLMEPNNAGPNDPLTMGLGPVGKSVYAVFLEQVDRSQWKCLFGDKEHPCGSQATSFKRLERALDHGGILILPAATPVSSQSLTSRTMSRGQKVHDAKP
ncbi:6089_t:CDS:2, partial [Acaulospora colombiana]